MNQNRTPDETTIEDAPSASWIPAITYASGPNQGESVEIKGALFKIGRARDNNLAIDERAASRYHAEIKLNDGRYAIKDLGSKWGLKLNGQIVKESELKFGDEIEIAGIMLNFNLVPKEKLTFKKKTNWLRIALFGLLAIAVAGSFLLFYFKHQVKNDLDRPGADVLSQIIFHYDKGISHYNQITTEGEVAKQKAVEEMEEVIKLDPEGKTQFSRSARRIIDGLGK